MRSLKALALGLTFFLAVSSQVTVTPLGEQMDLFGHISYVCFLERTGTIPRPHAPAMPDGIDKIRRILPSPDTGSGERYRQWAELDPAGRRELKQAALDPSNLRTEFTRPNYQTQHPPLYYWILLPVYRWVSQIPLDRQNLVLSLFSVFLAALAVPAVYLIFEQSFGSRKGLLATLMVVWLPNYMPFLGRITNDSLCFPLFSWSIYLLVQKNNTLRHRVGAAILIGIALFVKSYSLILLPLAVLMSWNLIGSGRPINSRLRAAALPTLILAFSAASLFFLNWRLSGNLLLLTEVRATAHAPLIQKIAGMFCLDPVWFYLNGLIRLFWWSGFWSIVSPGLYYYAPIAIFGAVTAYALFIKRSWRNRLCWREVLPHLVVIFAFVAGMAWHASLFEIANAGSGGGARSGNEGWYLLVIAPSIFLVLLSPIKWAVSEEIQGRLLLFFASGMVLWNLLGRLSSYMYWSGSVHIHHFVRGMDLRDTWTAVFDINSWKAWLSLPGIIHPVWLISLLPLLIAMIGTIYLISADAHGRKETQLSGA